MTNKGGTNNLGTIFKINSNGTGFAVLHSFTGGTSDGEYPYGDLIAIGSTLYGMTYGSSVMSDYNLGRIFKIQTNGTGYSIVHTFLGYSFDGANPRGDLKAINATLYGMTQYGGGYPDDTWDGCGALFGFSPSSGSTWLLHSFEDTGIEKQDGCYPVGSLIAIGSTLYGMTPSTGGLGQGGEIFKINTNGTGYLRLHYFAGGASDGELPQGSLVAKVSTLYGMTYQGGVYDSGTIFKIKTNGTGFKLLYSFSGILSPSDGAYPCGNLIAIGSVLYGMTYWGGMYNCGIIFSFSLI